MTRRVKEFIDIEDHASLEELITSLEALRDSLPSDAEAELRLRGDDVFGRKLSISYFREQTPEEAEFEKRYSDAYREGRERELDRLQEELGMVCLPHGGKDQISAVA